jgi:hypothetical protein
MDSESGLRWNWFGIASVVFTLAFWIYIASPSAGRSPYLKYMNVISLGILTLAIPASIVAARRGSKLWLISLLGPLSTLFLVWTFYND